MNTTILIIVWLITATALWIFATATTVDDGKFKHYEFRIRAIFYWLAVILSFIIGTRI